MLGMKSGVLAQSVERPRPFEPRPRHVWRSTIRDRASNVDLALLSGCRAHDQLGKKNFHFRFNKIWSGLLKDFYYKAPYHLSTLPKLLEYYYLGHCNELLICTFSTPRGASQLVAFTQVHTSDVNKMPRQRTFRAGVQTHDLRILSQGI